MIGRYLFRSWVDRSNPDELRAAKKRSRTRPGTASKEPMDSPQNHQRRQSVAVRPNPQLQLL